VYAASEEHSIWVWSVVAGASQVRT